MPFTSTQINDTSNGGGNFHPVNLQTPQYDGSQDTNNTAAVLGVTNNVNQSLLSKIGDVSGGAAQGIGEFAGNVATGAGKALVDTASGINTLENKAIDYGTQALTGQNPHTQTNPTVQAIQNSANTLDQGTIGKTIGEVGGNIAQFVAPGSGEEVAGAKVLPLIERIKSMLGFTGKAGETIGKVAQVGAKAAITGASTAGVTAVQTGGDINQIENAGALGAIAGGLGQTLESFGKGLSTAIAKSNFKLTPSQEAKAASKAESAAQFISNNKILGSESTKFQKLTNINQNLESSLQSSLPSNVGVSKQDVKSFMDSGVEALKTADPANYGKAAKQVEDAKSLLDSQKGTTQGYINMKDTLNSKRSYGSLAFNNSKAVVKDPNVSSEGAYITEQAYQQALEKRLNEVGGSINVPKGMEGMFGGKNQVSLPDFNKVYSSAISAHDFTRLAQYKNDTGLVGKLFAIGAGRAIGHAVAPGLLPEIAGATIGDIGANKLPSLVRNVSQRALSAGAKTPINMAKGILGANRTTVPNDENFPQQSQ